MMPGVLGLLPLDNLAAPSGAVSFGAHCMDVVVWTITIVGLVIAATVLIMMWKV
jgi:hypothetical protein